MDVRLEWLGVSTFRLTLGDTVVFLDGYMDRVPAAPPVGLSTNEVQRADWVLVGHSHFDHAWGAQTVATNTGARVVGSYETARIMAAAGVPREQLVPCAGGEPVRLADDVLCRVLPGLHSCIWASSVSSRADEACLGDLGVAHHDRLGGLEARRVRRRAAPDPDVGEHMRASNQGALGDGGALAYLIETPEGSIFWNDTSGHWSGILREVRADVALLAAAGRGNVDGEPIQGSLADFVAREAELIRPDVVIPCHHDDWMPPVTRPIDMDPVRFELAKRASHVAFRELDFSDPVPLLRRL